MRAWIERLRRERGQGLSEYAIIVALVAIASIVIVTAFGDQIREIFFKSGQRLAGENEAKIEDQVSPKEGSVKQGLDDWN
jgi:pilus assembly protein Flp/PilA